MTKALCVEVFYLEKNLGKSKKVVFQVREVSHSGLLKYQAFALAKNYPSMSSQSFLLVNHLKHN